MKYTVLNTKYRAYPEIINPGSDHQIQETPRKKCKKSLAKMIFENIYENKQDCPWFKPVDSPTLPTAVYT